MEAKCRQRKTITGLIHNITSSQIPKLRYPNNHVMPGNTPGIFTSSFKTPLSSLILCFSYNKSVIILTRFVILIFLPDRKGKNKPDY